MAKLLTHYCEHARDAPIPNISEALFSQMVADDAPPTEKARVWCAANSVMSALQNFQVAQSGNGREDSGSCRSSDTDRTHYDLQQRHLMVLTATVNGGIADRGQLIPIFARHLKHSGPDADMYDIFMKTHNELMEKVPDQIPEFRSTLTKKLCLKNMIRHSKVARSRPTPARNTPSLLSCVRSQTHQHTNMFGSFRSTM